MDLEVKRWLESQFGKRIVFPSKKAEKTYHEIKKLENVYEKAKNVIHHMEGNWISNGTDAIFELIQAISEYEE